jgi:MFS family permease
VRLGSASQLEGELTFPWGRDECGRDYLLPWLRARDRFRVYNTRFQTSLNTSFLLLELSSIPCYNITLLYSLPDFSASIGLSTSQSAAISAYLNLSTALGRPMAGFVSDKLGRIEVAGVLTAFCGVLCFAIWIPAKSYGVAILFAIVSGAVVGVFWMVS